ncbi:MAG: hypothetical protein WB995_01050 [Candidatus Acidiferrales bacterium]
MPKITQNQRALAIASAAAHIYAALIHDQATISSTSVTEAVNRAKEIVEAAAKAA